MEEKNDIGIRHLAHEHLLIRNENYVARSEYVVCSGCRERIDSCESVAYSCGGVQYECVEFLLHKTCAELPPKIVNPIDPNEFLLFNESVMLKFSHTCCIICGLDRTWINWFIYCSSFNTNVYVCFICALFQVQQFKEDPVFVHPGHSYHPLAVIQKPSSFECCACKVNDTILHSSYRCTKCQFWIHKSCGDAPHSFQFHFHKHPLILSFSLPQVYRNFDQFCRICNERLYWVEWLYCCRSCRYFTHFQCARSNPSLMLSSGENETYPDLLHLPAADEVSVNLLLEQFIKDKITLSDSYNNSSISSATNYIKHWSHVEHDLKLITISELYDGRNDDEILLLCDGCVKPIRTCDSLFYGCVPCKYFMHKVCAEFPREVEHHLWPPGKKLYANKYSQPFELSGSDGCGVFHNGICYGERMIHSNWRVGIRLRIGCVALPKVIKHEAHHHPLDQVIYKSVSWMSRPNCNACGYSELQCTHSCGKCNFNICGECIMKPRTYKHRWDPHPLDLIYDAGMIEEHEHEFDCEYCSQEINTNYWFYHCTKCDLSFHPRCIGKSPYRKYQYTKFGATEIMIPKLHRSCTLTLVLNKKARTCRHCGDKCLSEPVLRCAPCDIIFCRWCWK